jgi:hypothetical protein
MADGTSKPIDQIKVGDLVTNADPGAKLGTKDQAHTVTAVHVTRTDRHYTDVTVATAPTAKLAGAALLKDGALLTPVGIASATITGTAHHLYWDATTHTWTPPTSYTPATSSKPAPGTPRSSSTCATTPPPWSPTT